MNTWGEEDFQVFNEYRNLGYTQWQAYRMMTEDDYDPDNEEQSESGGG
jgi:hypothetical protein